MSHEFGWWDKDPAGRKFQVCVNIFGGNITWTRKLGHHQSWEPHPPAEADWDRLFSEAERRLLEGAVDVGERRVARLHLRHHLGGVEPARIVIVVVEADRGEDHLAAHVEPAAELLGRLHARDQLRRDGLVGLIVARERLQDRGIVDLLLEQLRRRLDEV